MESNIRKQRFAIPLTAAAPTLATPNEQIAARLTSDLRVLRKREHRIDGAEIMRPPP
jgi:hypothetical protein